MDHLLCEQIIPVGEGQFPVSARNLHMFLESRADFSTWIKERIQQYGFQEGADYQVFHQTVENLSGGRPSVEYLITINMAKELSMVERNERGKQARRYFIACEERLKAIAKPTCLEDLIILQAQSVKELKATVEQQGRTLALVKDTFAAHSDDWRDAINDGIKQIAKATERYHQFIWKEFYDLLEERGHCDLEIRLRHLKARMAERGTCRTEIKKANKLDTINEPALQEVALAIIKEMVAKYVA